MDGRTDVQMAIWVDLIIRQFIRCCTCQSHYKGAVIVLCEVQNAAHGLAPVQKRSETGPVLDQPSPEPGRSHKFHFQWRALGETANAGNKSWQYLHKKIQNNNSLCFKICQLICKLLKNKPYCCWFKNITNGNQIVCMPHVLRLLGNKNNTPAKQQLQHS